MAKRSKSSSGSLLPPILAGLLAGLAFFAGWGVVRASVMAVKAREMVQAERPLVHVVASGQTVYSIARLYGVEGKLIVRANGLKNPNRILAGQRLVIPPGTPQAGASRLSLPRRSVLSETKGSAAAIFHRVQTGETLGRIAARYQVSLGAIMAANGLKDPDYLFRGQRLLIPRPAPGEGVGLENAGTAGAGAGSGPPGNSSGGTPPANANLAATALVRREQTASRGLAGGSRPGVTLDWPMQGRITSGFGPRWGRLHEGIDIAGPTGAEVRAAAAGIVRQSGWAGGYGKLVILDHGGGLVTYYGHNSQLLVTRGMFVESGQVISRVGSTGDATGPHVHFEVRMHGRAQDPFLWLAPGRSNIKTAR